MHATCSKLRTAAYAKMDLKARMKQVGGAAGFPKNIRAEDILSVLRNVAAPPQHELEPVNVMDVVRAERAAILIQTVCRRRIQPKASNGP